MAGLAVLGCFMLLGGCGLFWWGRSSRADAAAGAAAARNWPFAHGIIDVSQVVRRSGEGDSGLRSTLQTHYYWVPEVRYRYMVGQTEHVGTRLRFGRFAFQSPAGAENVAANYPAGRTIMVRYDPSNPAESVIELETANAVSTQMVVFGVLLAIAGALLLLMAIAGVSS